MDKRRGTVAAHGRDVVFTLGPGNEFEHWSEGLAAITGVDEETLAAVDPASLFAPADREAVRAAIGRCLGEREASVEAALLTGDGDCRECRVTLLRYTDAHGSPAKIYGLVAIDGATGRQTCDGASQRLQQPAD